MRLFETLRRSLQLFKSSVVVIRQHPKLLLFPIAIGVCTVVIALFFLSPILFVPTGHSVFQAEHWSSLGNKLFVTQTGEHGGKVTPTWLLSGYCALLYLVSMFVATFCNVAFNSQVIAALNGEPVSIRSGFAIAGGRVKSVLVWSLFAGLVGLIIRQIETRLGLIGRLISGLIGLAWSVASVFAIPVLIREQPTCNPLRILSDSAGTIKRTWGEMLTGFVGLQGMNTLVVLSSLVLVGGSVAVAIALSSFWILIPVGAIWLLAMLAYSYLANVASQVYLCAVYIYASEGVVPEPYDQAMMDRAWKVKTPAN
jgi:hypothetical protein